MINVLIADDNMHFVKSLINYICTRDNKLRLINIANNGKEVLKAIRKNHIDVLILDLKMPKYSGIDFLKNLYSEDIKNIPQIIVISGENDLIKYIKNNRFVKSYVNKILGHERIYEEIQRIVDNDNRKNNIYKLIKRELISIGFNLKHIGAQYLAEAIKIVYFSDDIIYFNNLEKYVYPKIAQKYNKTKNNIKSNILKAINSMYVDTEMKIIKKYFLFNEDIKPTPKLIIATIREKLSNINEKIS